MLLRLFWNIHTREFVLWLMRFLPVKKKRTMFICWNGTQYGCNPKAISDALQTLDDSHEIAFGFVHPQMYEDICPKYVKKLELGSLLYYYYIETSKVVVSNTRFPQMYFPYKKKSQKYIYTGHGTFGIKKIEFDAEESLSPEYMKLASVDTSRTDLMLSNADYLINIYRKGYRYHGEILQQGIPRNDKLINMTDEKMHEQKLAFITEVMPEKVSAHADIHFLIYTPTFRAKAKSDVYGFDTERVLESLAKKYGGEWYLLVSSHPNMLSIYKDIYDFTNEHVIDVANRDLHSLLLFCDVLITDYSSVEMDFALLKRPVFQLCRDLGEYDRGFYIQPQTLPFPFATNDDELCRNIETFDTQEYLHKLDTFNRDVIGLKETGHASMAVAQWICKHTS